MEVFNSGLQPHIEYIPINISIEGCCIHVISSNQPFDNDFIHKILQDCTKVSLQHAKAESESISISVAKSWYEKKQKTGKKNSMMLGLHFLYENETTKQLVHKILHSALSGL